MTNAMTYNGYTARIEFDGDDRIFVGRVLGLSDIVGFHADTVAELEGAFRDAVDDYLESCAAVQKRPERSYSGNLMLRVEPTVHARAVIAAELSGKSLNQWSEDVLSEAIARTPATA